MENSYLEFREHCRELRECADRLDRTLNGPLTARIENNGRRMQRTAALMEEIIADVSQSKPRK